MHKFADKNIKIKMIDDALQVTMDGAESDILDTASGDSKLLI